MPVIKIKTTTRNKMGQQIVDDLDAGSGPSVLEFYTGTQPAGPDVAVTTQALLGELVCSDPSASITDGVITFGAITQDSLANNGGTATWARHKASNGTAVVDYDVTNAAGTGAIKLNTTTIVQGGPILMNSLTITVGGA